MVRVREFAIVAGVAFAAMSGTAAINGYLFHRESEVIALKTIVVQPAQQAAMATASAQIPQIPVAPPVTPPARAVAISRTSIVAALIDSAPKAPVRAPITPSVAMQVVAPPDMRIAAVAKIDAPPPAAPANPEQRLAAASTAVPLVTSDTANFAGAVALRVRDSVPSGLFPYFDVYLYVSKAAAGPWAQHMFIFHKSADNHLVFEQSIPVSTGRERREKYFTSTPTGLFELDPNRFDRNHHSHRWNNAPMPWAMFLDYTIDNHLAGVALHSGIGHVALLGQRASGGCVRLPPQMAETLFKRFQADEHGMVPVFAFNDSHSTTRTDGTLQLSADGQPVMTPGYKVLLIIQNYPGGPALVAEVS